MDIKELALVGDDPAQHWYYRSKAAALVRCLGGRRFSRVLDVGAGSGFFSCVLLERAIVRSAICVDTGYAQDHDQTIAGKTLSFRRAIEGDRADLVLLMDVLEHVDDDDALLASCVSKVPQDAAFFITVPAHPWLWSEHDEFLEHRRRYDLAQIECLVGRAGLQAVSCHYYFGFVLPFAASLRLAQRAISRPGRRRPQSQLQRLGRFSDGLLGGLCRAELPVMASNRLAGLSILCLASRRG
jgi:SAM-dependent methyltransferase